jgi:hypothetical protein
MRSPSLPHVSKLVLRVGLHGSRRWRALLMSYLNCFKLLQIDVRRIDSSVRRAADTYLPLSGWENSAARRKSWRAWVNDPRRSAMLPTLKHCDRRYCFTFSFAT